MFYIFQTTQEPQKNQTTKRHLLKNQKCSVSCHQSQSCHQRVPRKLCDGLRHEVHHDTNVPRVFITIVNCILLVVVLLKRVAVQPMVGSVNLSISGGGTSGNQCYCDGISMRHEPLHDQFRHDVLHDGIGPHCWKPSSKSGRIKRD